MKRTRIFDWKLVLSIVFGAMAFYLIWVGVTAVKDGHEKDARVDATIALLKDEQESSRLARINATAERAMLLEKQDDLLDEVAELQRKQAALLDYLRTQGITIPRSLTTTTQSAPTTPSTRKQSQGGDTPKGQGKAKGKNKKSSK